MTDQELVEHVRNGDMDAFTLLVNRNQDAIVRTVAAMLGNSSEVDDVVQEVFIKFYDSLGRFRGDAAPATYLKRMAINRSLDVLRRRKRTRAIFGAMDDPGTKPSFEDFDRATIVQQAIQELKPHHSAVVVLRLIEGYSTNEAAQILDIPVGTVLSRLSRASRVLREKLHPLMNEDA